MGTATVQSAAAPKPQPAPPSPPMPQSAPGHPSPMGMTVVELETAVAALSGKRDALREAFDRLAACSPSPLPFAWEDLDAHLSSLHSSISLRFRQLRVLEAARNAPAAAAFGGTRGGRTAGFLEEEEEVEEEVVVAEVEKEETLVEEVLVVEQTADEDMQEGDDDEAVDEIGYDGKDDDVEAVEGEEYVLEEEEVEEDNFGNEEAREEEHAGEVDEQDADEEMQVADEEELNTKCAFNPSLEEEEEEDTNIDVMVTKNAMQGKEEEESRMEEEHDTDMDQTATKKVRAMKDKEEEEEAITEEQDTDMDEMAAKVSAVQGKEEEACGEKQQDEAEVQGAHEEQEDAKNATEEAVVAKEVSRNKGNHDLPGRLNDRTAACTSMDAQRLVKLICTHTRLNSDTHNAVCRGPSAAALILQVVELFLHNKILKTKKVWANCVGLIQMVQVAVTKPSAETVERAKRVARDWNEMIGNPGSHMVLGNLASWGLLYFLISYNIVSEFDTKEIFHLFGSVPRKKQQNSALLFKASELNDRIPDLMDYLIENGQQLNVINLARVLNLVDKYPPLCLLKGYVERAKQIAMKISENKMKRKSLSAVLMEEIANLKRALDLSKQQITDSSLCTSIRAEISVLLDEFGKKKRSLVNGSRTITLNSLRQKFERNKKRKKEQEQEQEHHKGQENQQQEQASKPGEEVVKKQNKPQQEQQQKQKDKPEEKQQQKQKDKLEEKQQQKHSKRPRQRPPKLATRISPAVWSAAPRCHFGHPPYATMHHYGYPAQPGWPGNNFAMPFAPQLGAPGYMGPLNPFYSGP